MMTSSLSLPLSKRREQTGEESGEEESEEEEEGGGEQNAELVNLTSMGEKFAKRIKTARN